MSVELVQEHLDPSSNALQAGTGTQELGESTHTALTQIDMIKPAVIAFIFLSLCCKEEVGVHFQAGTCAAHSYAKIPKCLTESLRSVMRKQARNEVSLIGGKVQ